MSSRPLNAEEMERDEELIVHPGLASGSCSLESNPVNLHILIASFDVCSHI